MTRAQYDVLGIGNAIVDIIATAEDDFLHREAIQRGGMTLIDEPRAKHLYAAMGPAMVTSGGSAGNTMAGIASFGGRGAYIGKVRNDELGGLFTHDIQAIGVDFSSKPSRSGPSTARCMIRLTSRITGASLARSRRCSTTMRRPPGRSDRLSVASQRARAAASRTSCAAMGKRSKSTLPSGNGSAPRPTATVPG
jgi:sugar/nucleoside kinase (ribokinase family)